MIESVEHRLGLSTNCPDRSNGCRITARHTAGETRTLARHVGLVPYTTPIQSPQSNGMAEAFVKLIKRDYARVSLKPDTASVLR
jgi:putative transposase